MGIFEDAFGRGMWADTLLIWSSDNGGAVHLGGGANSFPLRGGYYNNWEGGTRVSALVNGGFLPERMRGRKMEEPMHEADWCKIATRSSATFSICCAQPPLSLS